MDPNHDPLNQDQSDEDVEIKQNFVIDDATPRKEQNISFGNKEAEIDQPAKKILMNSISLDKNIESKEKPVSRASDIQPNIQNEGDDVQKYTEVQNAVQQP